MKKLRTYLLPVSLLLFIFQTAKSQAYLTELYYSGHYRQVIDLSSQQIEK